MGCGTSTPAPDPLWDEAADDGIPHFRPSPAVRSDDAQQVVGVLLTSGVAYTEVAGARDDFRGNWAPMISTA